MSPSDVCKTTTGSTGLGGVGLGLVAERETDVAALIVPGPAATFDWPTSALEPLPQPVSQQARIKASTASPSNPKRTACMIEASLRTAIPRAAESSAVYPDRATSIWPRRRAASGR